MAKVIFDTHYCTVVKTAKIPSFVCVTVTRTITTVISVSTYSLSSCTAVEIMFHFTMNQTVSTIPVFQTDLFSIVITSVMSCRTILRGAITSAVRTVPVRVACYVTLASAKEVPRGIIVRPAKTSAVVSIPVR